MYEWLFDHIVNFLVLVLVSYPIIGGMAFIVSSIYQRIFNERRQLPNYVEGETPFQSLCQRIMKKHRLNQRLFI